MRIIWKDHIQPKRKSLNYRHYTISSYNKNDITGWIVNLPNDNNIYSSIYCAKNAIDLILGGYSSKGNLPTAKSRRLKLKCKIKIIGHY